ncbi:hypothetical protein [Amycolatopsis taiwanensis]|uniref:Uncharacterized protein n=1 Tax=Amycolatopsis taiwanensis TaxID=342230 RepID=A0A9W6R6C4_9PSEU|nr:hypothetical protein [Amycolatopsis taiwanensis]GLY69899.1 hypothetical protein Atai01_65180 [Amycolatopsis taiwanensis]
MNELDQRKPKRPGVAFAGFLVPVVLLGLVVLGLSRQVFWDTGWRAGEYAYAFAGIAIGAILVGCVLRILPPGSPWKSFGSGMVLGGTLGVVLTIVLGVVIMIAFSQSNWTF